MLVLEAYRNGMGADTLHLSQSVGKSVLGLLVGVLHERGALDPASPVVEHVPEVAGSGYDGATVQHLLDMTAAIDFVEDYAAGFWKYDVACAWHPPAPGADAETILAFLPTIGPAAWRARRAPALRDAEQRPAGHRRRARRRRAAGRADRARAVGAARRRARRPAHGRPCRHGGDRRRLLRHAARLRAARRARAARGRRRGTRPTGSTRLGAGDEAAFARSTWATTGSSGYGNQWWTLGRGPAARGIHGQLVAVDRDAGVVVALLSSWPEATADAREAAQRELVAALCER